MPRKKKVEEPVVNEVPKRKSDGRQPDPNLPEKKVIDGCCREMKNRPCADENLW